MAKTHRGSGIRDQYNRGRGECPVCKRNGIKIVYEYEVDNKKMNVCKQCKAALSSGKKNIEVLSG
ncbi:MAG: hypothetical protein DRP87_17100 [Spirochaetes bacterium]|nr:MAG: hypothetical protein DRP87_17100 [Spirochaetota bacterium]